MDLLDRLKEKQTEDNMSDVAFARRLGISRAMWIETKRGTYPIRFQVLAAAAREFPTLNDAILRYLATHTRSEKIVAVAN